MEVDSVQKATEFMGMSYRVITKIQKRKKEKGYQMNGSNETMNRWMMRNRPKKKEIRRERGEKLKNEHRSASRSPLGKWVGLRLSHTWTGNGRRE